MKMKKTWITKGGIEIKYKDLEYSHLQNIIKYIEKIAVQGFTVRAGGGSSLDDFWVDEYEIFGKDVKELFDYAGIKKELEKRKGGI